MSFQPLIVHGTSSPPSPSPWLEDEEGHRVVLAMATCERCGHLGYDVLSWSLQHGAEALLEHFADVIDLDALPDEVPTDVLGRTTCQACRTYLRQRYLEDPLVQAGKLVIVGLKNSNEPMYALADELQALRESHSVIECIDTNGQIVPVRRDQAVTFLRCPAGSAGVATGSDVHETGEDSTRLSSAVGGAEVIERIHGTDYALDNEHMRLPWWEDHDAGRRRARSQT